MSYTPEEMVAFMIAEVRKLALWADAPAAVISAHLLEKYGLKRWGEAEDLGVVLAKVQTYVASRQEDEDVARDEPPPVEVAEPEAPEDDAPWYDTVPGFGDAIHTDWLVSVTPNARGDYKTPNGVRFNITLHDGAGADDAIALVATMEAAMSQLAAHGIKPASPQAARPAQPQRPTQYTADGAAIKSAPPVGGKRPADQPAQDIADEPGQTVFGVDGLCYPGNEYVMRCGRMRQDPTKDGDARVTFIYERSKYDSGITAFPGEDGKTFAHILATTGVDPQTLEDTAHFDPAIPVIFQLGKKKESGKGRYLDLVRIDMPDHEMPF